MVLLTHGAGHENGKERADAQGNIVVSIDALARGGCFTSDTVPGRLA